MVTARYLTDKFLDPWREKIKAEVKAEVEAEVKAEGIEMGKAQGLEAGLAQKQREWEIWLREKEDATERGEPFDDPPPSI